MKLQRLTCLALLSTLLLFSACLDDMNWQGTDDNDNPVAVVFNSEIQTRVSGTSWEKGDSIGIYMKSSGKTLAQDDNLLEANKKYITEGTKEFKPATEEDGVYFPESGNAVDFIAYYPYRQMTGFTFMVDVSGDQTNRSGELDILYSNSLVNAKKTSDHKLTFTHKLAAINLNIEEKQDKVLTGMTVSITGTRTTASFSLVTGSFTAQTTSKEIKPSIKMNGTKKATAEGIIIPITGLTGGKITLYIPSHNRSYEWDIPANQNYEGGKKYSYDFDIEAEGLVVLNPESNITDWDDEDGGKVIIDDEEEDENGDGNNDDDDDDGNNENDDDDNENEEE